MKESNGKGVLEEAIGLVNGSRARLYGGDSTRTGKLYEMIAASWSAKLQATVQPRDVPLMLADMKICREVCFPNRDNRVDIAGYMPVVDLVDNHAAKVNNPDDKVDNPNPECTNVPIKHTPPDKYEIVPTKTSDGDVISYHAELGRCAT